MHYQQAHASRSSMVYFFYSPLIRLPKLKRLSKKVSLYDLVFFSCCHRTNHHEWSNLLKLWLQQRSWRVNSSWYNGKYNSGNNQCTWSNVMYHLNLLWYQQLCKMVRFGTSLRSIGNRRLHGFGGADALISA